MTAQGTATSSAFVPQHGGDATTSICPSLGPLINCANTKNCRIISLFEKNAPYRRDSRHLPTVFQHCQHGRFCFRRNCTVNHFPILNCIQLIQTPGGHKVVLYRNLTRRTLHRYAHLYLGFQFDSHSLFHGITARVFHQIRTPRRKYGPRSPISPVFLTYTIQFGRLTLNAQNKLCAPPPVRRLCGINVFCACPFINLGLN